MYVSEIQTSESVFAGIEFVVAIENLDKNKE